MTIPEILKTYRTIAVLGLSSSPWRPSYGVTEYMKSHGYRIIPVNPNETEVLGETAVSELTDINEPVEIVNVFRRSEFVSDIVDQAIQISAKVLWLQEGVVDEVAAQRARDAGLEVVMDLCILKEHKMIR
jgi:predicted CoA-binding protein